MLWKVGAARDEIIFIKINCLVNKKKYLIITRKQVLLSSDNEKCNLSS